MQASSHANVAKDHVCMTTNGIMDVQPGRSLYITIKSVSMAEVRLTKHQRVGEVAITPK